MHSKIMSGNLTSSICDFNMLRGINTSRQFHKRAIGVSVLALVLLTACGGGSSGDGGGVIGGGANDGGANDGGANGGDGDDAGANGGGVATLPTPTRSSTIAITSDDSRLVVVNSQNNTVSVIRVRDEEGNDVEQLLAEVPVGNDPHSVAISPDDRTAFVSNSEDGSVSVINLAASTPVIVNPSIAVGNEPRGVAVSPNGVYVYVANHTDGTVTSILTGTREVISTVSVGGNPTAVAITNDGDTDDTDETVVVTRFFSEVIDPVARPDGFNDSKAGKLASFNVGESIFNGPTPDLGLTILSINPLADSGFTADRRQFCQNTRNILNDSAEVLFFNSGVDGSNREAGTANLKSSIFCPDVNSTDATAAGPIGSDPQGAYPNQLFGAIIRNDRVFVPNIGASPEPPVRFNVNVQSLISSVNLITGADITTNLNAQIRAEAEPSVPNESLEKLFANDIVAMDANSDGSQALIVSRGGNYVIRASIGNDGSVDIGSNPIRYQTGNIPTGVVYSSSGARAYANNEINTSVTSIDLVNNQVLNRDISSSEPPAPGTQKHRNVVGKLAFYSALGLADNGVFNMGLRDINPLQFRGKASDNAWSSCASCHDEGRTDNVTWIFPTGPRQTVPLEGTFANSNSADQRILNWNAVRGSVTDFNNNSRGVQGGIGHADEQGNTGLVFNHGPTSGVSDTLDAMTEWVANSVRAPIMANIDPAVEASGRATFETNCASCHGGEKWTKSSILAYQNNPTFNANPLGANFFAAGREPALDPGLTVGGPQIVAFDGARFLDDVGTLNPANDLEIRGAGALGGGGAITIAGDPNEGVTPGAQSTQGIGPLGGAGFNSPSLMGVAYHSPYLHDGSLITLEEVFAVHTLPDGDDTTADPTITSVVGQGAALDNLLKFVLSIDDDTPPVP